MSILDLMADKIQAGFMETNDIAKRLLGAPKPKPQPTLSGDSALKFIQSEQRAEAIRELQEEPQRARTRGFMKEVDREKQLMQNYADRGISALMGKAPEAQAAAPVVSNDNLPTTGWYGFYGKYAPPTENDTVAYANNVAKDLGIDPMNVTRSELLTKLPKWAEIKAKYEGFFNGDPLSAPVRNNNPGNLEFAGQPGAVPDPENPRFAKFGSPRLGWAALQKQLLLDVDRFFPE